MPIQCLEKDVLMAIKLGNADEVRNKFDELDLQLKVSDTPTEDANMFLELFISDMNEQYKTNFTLQEAWQFADKNLHFVDLQHKTKVAAGKAINLFKPIKDFYVSEWFGSLFVTPIHYGPKDLEKIRSKNKSKNVEGLPGQLHPGTVVGGLEMIVGGAVLLCFGGTVAGGVLGAGLIGDGIRRIADDGQTDFESSLKNRHPIHQTIR